MSDTPDDHLLVTDEALRALLKEAYAEDNARLIATARCALGTLGGDDSTILRARYACSAAINARAKDAK